MLGGGLLPDGSPDASTLRRAAATAALAQARPEATVIVSGQGPPPSEATVRAGEGVSEAAHLARILRERGIAADRIHLEDESMDTLGNAVLTAARYLRGLRPRPLVIVTSPFHAERARRAFARALPGWELAVHPCAAGAEDAPRLVNEPAFRRANEELLDGIADGDLAGMFDRLVARWPEYERYRGRIG